MPKTIKQVERLIGFAQFFRNYMPDLGTNLMPFYHLLKKDRELEITEEQRKSLATIKTRFAKSNRNNTSTTKTRTTICDTLRC